MRTTLLIVMVLIALVFLPALNQLDLCRSSGLALADDVTAGGRRAGFQPAQSPQAGQVENLSYGQAQLVKILQSPLLIKGTPQQEVQNLIEKRTPRMAEVRSREGWEKLARQLRQRVLEEVVYRGEAARWRDASAGIQWLEEIEGGAEYHIRKLRYEALPGLWIPALLYEPKKLSQFPTSKVPVALNVNGHDAKGKAVDYKQIRCINLAKRGVLALNVEWLGMGQLRGDGYAHYRMNQLDLCGTSGLAPFYLAMKRGLDILLAHKHADPQRVAVAGLSGGGWQTIILSSLDTRVTLANPVAGYSSFLTRAQHHKDLGDSEQTPCDLAVVADYTHLTGLLAPRPALLTYCRKDNCCFEAPYALPPLLVAAEPIYALYNKKDNLRSHINDDPGTHNFEKDNRQALYKMVGDHFFPDKADYQAEEIACAEEVKTAEQLFVPLPENNETFHSLAVKLSQTLPRLAKLPTDRKAAEVWQNQASKKLREVLRWPDFDLSVEKIREISGGSKDDSKFRVARRRFRFKSSKDGHVWTAPVVEIAPDEGKTAPPAPQVTMVLVGDQGRAKLAKEALAHLELGRRVLAVDPFYFGESRIQGRDFLFALLVATVGQRPLGIQANQVAQVGRWAQNQYGGVVRVAAHGRRSSLICLAAAAADQRAFDGFQLHGSFGSLKQVIEQNLAVNQTPELFCFGLLEHFDIVQLAAMAGPTRGEFLDADQRVARELKPLKAWNALFGLRYDPLMMKQTTE